LKINVKLLKVENAETQQAEAISLPIQSIDEEVRKYQNKEISIDSLMSFIEKDVKTTKFFLF